MYYTVKTLHERGYSKRKIAKDLGIHRKTVSRILDRLSKGISEPAPIKRDKLLDQHEERIKDWLEQGKSSVLIHEFLRDRYSVNVAYTTVVKYVRALTQGEVFIPLLSEPGEEAQVDFGYLGLFEKDGRKVKVWGFSMVLSHSRYSYHELVLDQSVKTFIGCHIHAFEFFGGVPKTVKIDNLKAGVLIPDFFEPVIQHQYAEFLVHYKSAPITCRIRRGQDKGKVESGVKYLKNNFVKRADHHSYYQLETDLERWTTAICNERLHGTTRKVPARVFEQVEKNALLQLPQQRYELYDIEKRKASAYAHVSYMYNYYSVPSQYAGQDLIVKCNGSLVKVYKDNENIAIHNLGRGQGEYITIEAHKPIHKQKKSREYYHDRLKAIGPSAVVMMQELERIKPRHWHEMVRGIISLEKYYDRDLIELSCLRALSYGALSYREVKNILEQKLYELPEEPILQECLGGFAHDLKVYDNIIS